MSLSRNNPLIQYVIKVSTVHIFQTKEEVFTNYKNNKKKFSLFIKLLKEIFAIYKTI